MYLCKLAKNRVYSISFWPKIGVFSIFSLQKYRSISIILPEIRVKIEILAYLHCLKLKFVGKWGSILYHDIISQKVGLSYKLSATAKKGDLSV